MLSILNHDSAVAAAGARMTVAAGDRPCIEMGSRRTHEQAAVAAARAAYVVGFEATSNLEAGRRYDIPTTGTSAHAFTLAHDSERDAFEAQVAVARRGTTLLVDTYDVMQGVRTAVEVAGPGARRRPAGQRRPRAACRRGARQLLDSLGATATRIIVTSDLDEYAIAALAAAPVDGYGVGTALVTGSGAPTAGFVYKLVERGGRPVDEALDRARSPAAAARAWPRRLDASGRGARRRGRARPRSRRWVRGCARCTNRWCAPASGSPTSASPRRGSRWTQSRAELPAAGARLSAGDPALPASLRRLLVADFRQVAAACA